MRWRRLCSILPHRRMTDEELRPPNRPYGRSWSDFEPVLDMEKKLAEKVRKAEKCIFNPHETTIIRAGFLRFLALGGDETAPVHEKGIWLQGAIIEGQLDLDGATLPFDLFLLHCHPAPLHPRERPAPDLQGAPGAREGGQDLLPVPLPRRGGAAARDQRRTERGRAVEQRQRLRVLRPPRRAQQQPRRGPRAE